jgi:hypothetical protein
MSTGGVLSSTASFGPGSNGAIDPCVQDLCTFQEQSLAALLDSTAERERERGEQPACVFFSVDDIAGDWRVATTVFRREGLRHEDQQHQHGIIWYLPQLYLKSRYEYLLTLIHSEVRPSLTLLRLMTPR